MAEATAPAAPAAPTTTPTDAKVASTQPPVTGSNQPTTGSLTSDAAKEAMRKFKIDDQEIDEEEVLKVYKERKGHQSAANKILQEGKASKKQAEEFIAMMKDKQQLFDVIKKLGHDPRALSEEYLASILEDEMLDPRDKELKETKLKLAQIEANEKAREKQVEEQRNNMLKEKYAKDFNTQFVEALNTSGLPPTKPMVAEMAKYVGRAAQLGFKMTPAEAAQLVKEDLEKFTRSVIGATDGDMLVKLLGGDEVVNKIRKWDTSRLKSPEDNLKTPTEQGERKARTPANRRMTPKEWRDYNRGK